MRLSLQKYEKTFTFMKIIKSCQKEEMFSIQITK